MSACTSPSVAPLYLLIPGPQAEQTLALLFRHPVLLEPLSAISSMICILSVMFSMTLTGPQQSSP